LFLFLFSHVDELVDAFRGQSPCRVYIPKKPHPNGHLVYECVSVSRQHSLPFLYRVFSYFGGERAGTKEVLEKSLQDVPPCHVFMDSWFPSKESIERMDTAHQNYKATVNKKRWSHLWSVLGKNTAIGEVGIA